MNKIIIEYRELKDLPKKKQIKIIEKYIVNGYFFDFTDPKLLDLYIFLSKNDFDFFNTDSDIKKQWIINNPITSELIHCMCEYEHFLNKNNEKIFDSMIYFHKFKKTVKINGVN